MAHIENEVAIRMYRVAQNLETKKVTFWVYNDLVDEMEFENLLTHEQLYGLLCEKVQYLHQGGVV